MLDLGAKIKSNLEPLEQTDLEWYFSSFNKSIQFAYVELELPTKSNEKINDVLNNSFIYLKQTYEKSSLATIIIRYNNDVNKDFLSNIRFNLTYNIYGHQYIPVRLYLPYRPSNQYLSEQQCGLLYLDNDCKLFLKILKMSRKPVVDSHYNQIIVKPLKILEYTYNGN